MNLQYQNTGWSTHAGHSLINHLAASPLGALARRSAKPEATSASVRSTPCFSSAAFSSSDAAEAC